MFDSLRPPRINGLVAVGCVVLLALAGMAVLATRSADAAYYKMVACSANNGPPPYQSDTNTKSDDYPNGIFNVWNRCDAEGGDPPGDSSLIRIQEDRDPPNAIRQGAYANVFFDAPPGVHFKAAGGFTREPFQFNDGWRARFWIANSSSTQQIMAQGAGTEAPGLLPSSNIFGPHLWPEGGYLDFNRFVFELMCVRAARCDVSGNNAADLNGLVFILADDSDSHPEFTQTEAPLLADRWVTGNQKATFSVSDAGSGIRGERLYVDGSEISNLDHGAECSTSFTPSNGEWAKSYTPCPTGGPWDRSVAFNTAAFKDGSHTIQVCTQDFAQFQGLDGTGGQTCTARTIATDNTAPAAPTGLSVVTPNPARYLSQIGAQFTLPPSEGSPITKAFYNIVDAAGNVVTPAQEVNGVNPTAIQTINGPQEPGDYRLRVWLQDEVGFVGPPATVPIPHDTTPPAAPQNLSVVAPKSPRGAAGFDATWNNIADEGSPIDAAHYKILNAEGATVVDDTMVAGEGVESIRSLDTPRDRGGFTLQLWLEDAEGNIGAPVSVPLVYDCVRDDVDSGAALSASVGPEGAGRTLVGQGDGGLLQGRLVDGNGGPVSDAPICVFSQVVTDSVRKFLGVAMTGADGSYEFAVQPGATRDLMADYRSEHREISSKVQLVTRVKPTFEIENEVVGGKNVARFRGSLPGPDNDHVIVTLEARKGKGWIVFRRLSTGEHGNYEGTYQFNKTTVPTEFVMKAQVRKQGGFPYAGGSSDEVSLVIHPPKQDDLGHGKRDDKKHKGEKKGGNNEIGNGGRKHRNRRHQDREAICTGRHDADLRHCGSTVRSR